MTTGKWRRHTPEFRVSIAQQMVDGANVMALSREHQLPRSMMYRWKAVLLKHGTEALSRPAGRPPTPCPSPLTAREIKAKAGDSPQQQTVLEETLRRRITELERKVGQQAVEIDFFRGVFKRLAAWPKTRPDGDKRSTPKSDA